MGKLIQMFPRAQLLESQATQPAAADRGRLMNEDDRKKAEAAAWKEANEWKNTLPSAEHRRHIRLFQKSDLTDEEDVALRGYVVWKRLEHTLQSIRPAAAIKRPSKRRSK
jgi:hypothetical protein